MLQYLRILAWVVLALSALPARAQSIEVVTEGGAYSYFRDGAVGGAASQLVEDMLRRAGLRDYRITLYPWARAYDIAQRDANVLIYPLARNPEREGAFKWVGEFSRVEAGFYRLSSNSLVKVDQLKDAQRYIVGVVRDDWRDQFLRAHGFTKLVTSANHDENFRKLLGGQVDLIAITERDARRLTGEAGLDETALTKVFATRDMSLGVYFAYSLSTSDEVVSKTRAAFEALKAEGVLARFPQGSAAGQP